MAATTNAASYSSSSICNKISNLSIRTTRFSTHYPKHLKPLSLKLQFPNFPSLSLLLSSLPRFRRSSAAYDDVQLENEIPSSDEEYPEAESPEEQDGPEEQVEQEPKVSGSGGEAGRLYVGNLPYYMDSSQLAEIFGEAGSVVSVEVIYDRVTDRSRGFAFVTMGSFEEAQEAIRKFDGSQVGGRTVKVNFPEVPRGGEREVLGPKIRNINRSFIDSPHKIYAGNLGWGLTSEGLRDAFANQPGLLSAKVIYERDTGRSRGFGFITFDTAEAAQSALDAMDGVEVEGRPLRLNMAADRTPRASAPAPEVVTENADSGELLAGLNT